MTFEEVVAADSASLHRASQVFAVRFMTFLVGPVGWVSDWHCAPGRGIFFVLSCEIEIEVSDGKVGQSVTGAHSLKSSPYKTPEANKSV